MKLYLDIKNRRFVKSAASNVALSTLVLKRRDRVPLELVYVENGSAITPPAGTTASIGLKSKFSDTNFLAFAAPGTTTLDLFTQPVEAAFSSNHASLPALLEVAWGVPGTAHRTATLQVELQNAVILGDEGTPSVIADLKATQAEAEAGTDNTRWLTPLRTFQAIAAWVSANLSWSTLTGKPTSFPPAAHNHTAAEITDFTQAVVAAAPPTTNASLLTSGTLADERLSTEVTASLAKADTASQPGHSHTISEVTGLPEALAEKASVNEVNAVTEALADESEARATGDQSLAGGLNILNTALSSETTARLQGDSLLGDRIDTLASAVTSADTLLGNRLDTLASAVASADSAETLAREAADATLQQNLLDLQSEPGGGTIYEGVAARAVALWDPTFAANDADGQALRVIEGGVEVPADWKPRFRDAFNAQPAGDYATLIEGKVPADQLPSYVDDVLEVADYASLPASGETGKIYVTTTAPSKAYRWTGSTYLEISPSEVTSVAGKTGAVTLSKSDVGLDQVSNTSDAAKPVSTAQQLALDAKQNLRTTDSRILQDGDNYIPVSRNTLYLLSGSFTTARIKLPTYLPNGTGAWVGDRIRIVWVGVKANANSRINVIAYAGDGQYPSLAQLHDQDQAAEFVLDPIPRNASGQLTWRADIDPIRWVQPPATPASFVAPNGAAYSPSDVAFDGSYFYIRGQKTDGSPVWLRTPMTATW